MSADISSMPSSVSAEDVEGVKKSSLWDDIMKNKLWKKCLFLGCSGGLLLGLLQIITAKEWLALAFLCFVGSLITTKIFGGKQTITQLLTVIAILLFLVSVACFIFPWLILFIAIIALVVFGMSETE